MTTTTIRINSSRNSSLNGKTGTVEGDTLKVGRTTYKIRWGTHQPRKDQGDFTIAPATLGDLEPFMISRDGKGETMVRNYTIISADLPLTEETEETKSGDYVRVPEFDREVDYTPRHKDTYREGVVEAIATDPRDGVTYLHILQIRFVWDGDVVEDRHKKPVGEPNKFRTPINGTKTWTGKTLGRVIKVDAPWA